MHKWGGLNGPVVIPASNNQEMEIYMKDYSCFSDNEINEMVADLRGGYAGNVHGSETAVKVSDAATNGLFYMEVDYCSNPSDAWPIMEEGKIGLAFVNGEWRASSVMDGYHEFSDKKAFRAAMIVYLMMKDAE